MVTNQTIRMLQEKSAIPLSCYLQIWLNLRSCYCNQCYRQQTARQAQMSAWSWKNQHISSAVSLNTKYSDPSSEFESSIFCKSATRHIHFNFIRSQYWPSQLYIYINHSGSTTSSPKCSWAAALVFATPEALCHHPWKQKASILLRTRRGDYRMTLFRWCLCPVQMGYWAFLSGKVPSIEEILSFRWRSH